MSSGIPWQIRAGVRSLLAGPARFAYLSTLIKVSRAPGKEPVVSFGNVLDPGRTVHGGAVKLLHLQKALPSHAEQFNILYLVSSAQPDFALDLVHCAKRNGIPFVWNQNGVAYPGWAGAESERYNGPMRTLRAQADYVIYQSEFCRTSAEKFLGPCATAHEVLFNPIDLQKFSPPAVPKNSQSLRLLAIGTHGYAQRVLSPIQCLRALKDAGVSCTLTIVGKLGWPNGSAETQAEIKRLSLEGDISLHPAFTQEQAAEFYRSHDILLHPKYLDPCPTVVIESLAAGLPIVGSASGGLPEMVPSECGVLIPAPVVWDKMVTPTGEELAAAVQSLIPRLAEASAAARRHAETHFNGVNWIARHDQIFRRLLA